MTTETGRQTHYYHGILTALLFLLAACVGRQGELKPMAPTAEPGGEIAGQPQLVTLSELQTDPYAYQDQIVRVSGTYHLLPAPECSPFNGPGAKWALIAENLRLDVVGYESTIQLVALQTTFTVDGLFRLYEGPVGCGKEPATGFGWYLEVLRIVQPNPLARSIELAQAGSLPSIPQSLITSTPSDPGSVVPTAQPTVGSGSPTVNVPTATVEAVSTPISTPDAPTTPIATNTAGPTSDATATTTPTVSSTPTSQTMTPTVLPTAGPSPTAFPTQPPLPTSTPGGYPPPTPPPSYP